jgi:hypothetical protein
MRAARMLWFYLAKHLTPAEAPIAIAAIHTTQVRAFDLPTITHRIEVNRRAGETYTVTGWAGDQQWTAEFHSRDARRLCDALTVVLSG